MDSRASTNTAKNSFTLRLDYRIIIGFLLLVILAMVVLWRPWEPRFDADSRTISVAGESVVSAAPDEYIFTPTYEFKNDDRDAAIKGLSDKSNEIVTKLKQLGVSEADIKTESNGYDYPTYTLDEKQESTPTYSLRMTITISRKLGEMVQNYLVTTSPVGSISPQYGFSDATRKDLESKARDESTKDARRKAEQSAKNLGFKIGAVKEVSDGSSLGSAPTMMRGDVGITEGALIDGLTVQPGENELSYQVNVVYFVK